MANFGANAQYDWQNGIVRLPLPDPFNQHYGLLGTINGANHEFGIDKMQGFRPYSELKEVDDKFKKEFASTFNLWEGKKHKSNILTYKKDYSGYHPTQKPILLLEDLIKTFSNENGLVVDLTMGSGSTMVACKNTERRGVGIEKEEKYYKIAQQRIKNIQKRLF